MNTAKLDQYLSRSAKRRSLPDPSMRQQIREGAGLTQREVAEVLGVTRVTVARWEGGVRMPRGRHLDDYVDLLERLTGP